MPRRTKLLMASMAVVLVLGLTGVTRAWFVSLTATPPGVVDSALVHYLPERELRDVDALLAYGDLISGRSVGPDGVPLILPGDRLLSGKRVQVDGGVTTTTLRTSTARPYESGETQGTVIDRETRYAPDGTPVTRRQRHLMDVASTDQWFEGETLLTDIPTLEPSQYEPETVSTTDEREVGGQTIITSTITTTYTPRSDALSTYRHVITSTVTITHEAATIDPAGASLDVLPPVPSVTTKETVLYADAGGKLPTRSYQIVTFQRPYAAGDTATTEDVPIPLSVENFSTTETRLRLAMSAVVVKNGTAQSLVQKSTTQNGVTTYHFGQYYTVGERSYFIELLSITPAEGWGQAQDPESGSLWTLWDRTEAVPVVRDEESQEIVPTRYPVVDAFSVAAETSFGADGVTKDIFEAGFNQLYSTGTPTVEIRLRFYARQDAYMDWREFLSKDLSLTLEDVGKGVAP